MTGKNGKNGKGGSKGAITFLCIFLNFSHKKESKKERKTEKKWDRKTVTLKISSKNCIKIIQ